MRSNNIPKIILGGLLLLAITLLSMQVYASSGGGGHGAHHAPPLKYFINWLVLLFAWGTVFIYLKKRFGNSGHEAEHYYGEGEHAEDAVHEEHGGHGDDDDEEGGHHGIHVVQEAKGRSALLCGLVIFMFFIAYAPSLAGYHESVPVSMIKFVIQMSLGVFLTIFGILGMDEH